MKVLHVFGGIRTFKIARWQALKNLDVHKVMIEDSKPFESYFKDTDIKFYKNDTLTRIYEKVRGKRFLFFRLHLLLYPFYLALISNALRKVKPDIVHAYRHTGALLTILAKKLSGSKAKIVFDYQDPWSGEDRANRSWYHRIIANIFYSFEKYIVNNSDLIVTQGKEQTDMLVKRYNFPTEKMIYTLNTSDKDLFKVYKKERTELRKEYGINKNVAVLYLGSIVDSHGVGMLPQAANEVLKKFPGTKFVMLGVVRDKNFWDSIKNDIKKYNIEKSFIEIWPNKKSDLPKLISMCDVGLILHKKGSLIGEISIPSKLFEYMSCGLAVVSSNLKHITQFIIPEKAGVTFEPNSVENLASVLKELLKKPSQIAVFGKNARMAVEKKYNWDIDMKNLLNGYKFLLSN